MSTRTETAWKSRLIERIAHVELRVQDIDRSIGFYSGLLGFEVAERSPGRAVLGAPGGTPFLSLTSEGVGAPASPFATGLFHTAFLYPDRRALGETLARVADAGYAIGAGDHLVSEALYVDDPDGNGVEMYRDRPREQWPAPRPGDLVAMATEPVDLDALVEDALSAGPVRAQAPSDTRVGHVHLQVSDVERTIGFYRDVLGLDLMARFGSQAGFFASNGYHHHVGANAWRSRGQGPASPDHAGLDRVTFEVRPEELEALRARLRSTSAPFADADGSLEVTDSDGMVLRFASTA